MTTFGMTREEKEEEKRIRLLMIKSGNAGQPAHGDICADNTRYYCRRCHENHIIDLRHIKDTWEDAQYLASDFRNDRVMLGRPAATRNVFVEDEKARLLADAIAHRDMQHVVKRFVDECCEQKHANKLNAESLWEAWIRWNVRSNLSGGVKDKRTLVGILGKLGYTVSTTTPRCVVGLTLVSQASTHEHFEGEDMIQ